MLLLAKRSQLLFYNIVSTSGIVVDLAKIKAIMQWQMRDQYQRQIVSWVWHAIIGGLFSFIAAPCIKLTRKEERFTWIEDCEQRF